MQMTGPILVTGASGLLGANICAVARAKNRPVRALIRSKADAAPLEALGVEIAYGDISDLASIKAAVAGVSGIIHTVGLVGGTWSKSTPEQFHQVNYVGAANMMDVAVEAGGVRTIIVSTISIFDPRVTVTEHSAIIPISDGDSPYTRSKRASYYDGMHRASLGQNVAFMMPAAIYGPSPNVDRAVADTSFNAAIPRALKGELEEYAAFPMNWVYAQDAAEVALGAVDDTLIGACYLGGGLVEDEQPMALFCNAAAEIAGSDRRVRNVPLSELKAGIGPMAALASRTYATPFFDGSGTRTRLGLTATPLSVGLERTVAWLKEHGKI
jgi:nucleoside-diphosphate-sugar epimerase